MGTRRKKKTEEEEEASLSENESSKRVKTEDDNSCRYEQAREQRIKENKERMHKLGLFDLSFNLKPQIKNPPQKKKKKTTPEPKHSPQRRSSRIMTLEPVNYYEKRVSSDSSSKGAKEVEIIIPEGTNPEIYTEEHEKLLGDCETTWDLYVDGYDEDGNRIYDPIKGETCHQCRQKTLGEHTQCNKCELDQGQFCGDCLFTRYGENVMEANTNRNWTCPPCRDICNCSRCRRGKGWMPTGNIYNKVTKLGFKSVAHYLIKTRRSELLEDSNAENIVVEEIPETSADTN